MPATFRFACPLPNGLHARPATALAQAAVSFESTVVLTHLGSGATADAKSVLELVAAGVLHGDECEIVCDGADAADAGAALAEFIRTELSRHDAPLPERSAQAAGRIPPMLRDSAANIVTGIPASPGLGRGKLIQVSGLQLPEQLHKASAHDPAHERQLADAAFTKAITALRGDVAQNATAAQIRQALAALADDPTLRRLVAEGISKQGLTAAQAVVAAVEEFASRLRGSQSEYLSSRAADLEDIALQVLAQLPGVGHLQPEIRLDGPTILAAQSLATSQFLGLDRSKLAGLVLGEAGTTSHVVILSRSFGIPCIAGVDIAALGGGEAEAVISGSHGILATPVTGEVERYFRRESNIAERLALHTTAAGPSEAVTNDGHRIELGANISTAEEAGTALANGAAGIGLFRTEMLFSAAAAEPSVEEQYNIYSSAASTLGGRPVIIRTLDVGGDKPLSYLDLPAESNPFLGFRGIRIYQRYAELFRRQLRAIVRASADGNVWVMAPMVSGLDEARWFREQVTAVQNELAAEGVPFNPEMPVGIMVEVPSAALVVDQLCEVVDFFSVGTNDLTQYLLAVERGNPQVAQLYEELHPALIRLLGQIVEAAHARGKWAGICGELARNPRYAPLLTGLGFDELSMSAPAIPAVKSAIAAHSYTACRELALQALHCTDAQQIRALLDRHHASGADQPLLAPELIALNSDCTSKPEAIRELCAMAGLAGRCRDIDRLEDAVWAREETFATGLGHGFAIPHCRAEVAAGTLALLRLRQPVEWGSVDDRPVDMVLMLVMPTGDADNRHLKVFAALARKLMHEEFRSALRNLDSADGIMSYLESELELKTHKES